MTDYDKIDEVIALGDKATQGEWDYKPEGAENVFSLPVMGWFYKVNEQHDNAKFLISCANARDAIKAMRDENKALKERVEELPELIDDLDFIENWIHTNDISSGSISNAINRIKQVIGGKEE